MTSIDLTGGEVLAGGDDVDALTVDVDDAAGPQIAHRHAGRSHQRPSGLAFGALGPFDAIGLEPVVAAEPPEPPARRPLR